MTLLLMFLLQTTPAAAQQPQSLRHAYPAPDSWFRGQQGSVFYHNDFEHYLEGQSPWFGTGFVAWTARTIDSAQSGSKVLLGRAPTSLFPHRWAVSERFALDDTTRHLSVRMAVRFFFGENVWQIVPQGETFVACRLTVDENGRIHIFDDLSQGQTQTPTDAYVQMVYLDNRWEQVEFKIDRQNRDLRVFFNGKLIYTGRVIDAEISTIALTMENNSRSVRSHMDDVIVEADLQAVPLLSPFALLFFVACLMLTALILQRRNRTATC